MDEASGNAIDAHGSNDLTDTNTVGAAGGMRDFEADNAEYFTINDNDELSTGTAVSWTFAAWVRPETTGGFPMIGMKGWGDAGEREWVLYLSSAALTMEWDNGSGTGSLTETTTGALSADTLYFVTCGYDATNDLFHVSVNAGTAQSDSEATGARAGAGPFVIGASPLQTVYWDGRIGPTGFWKRALTGAERTELYNAGTPLTYADLAQDIEIASAVMQKDGKRIRLTFTANGTVTGTTGFTPKIGGVSKTVGKYLQISAAVWDLYLDNPDVGLTGNTITYDYDSGAGDFADDAGDLASVTAGAVTNNSLQTATKIVVPVTATKNIEYTFASIEGRAMTMAHRWEVEEGSILNSTTPAQAGTGGTRRNGSQINPNFLNREQALDGRVGTYEETAAVTFPHTFAAGETMVTAYSIGEEIEGGWPSETAVTAGEWIASSGGTVQVAQASGTTSDTEPTWANTGDTYVDGTVTWETYGSPILEAGSALHCYATGAAPDVTDFSPPYIDTTKTRYNSAGMLARLPAGFSAPAGAPTLATTLAASSLPWLMMEGTFIGQYTRPYRNFTRAGAIVSDYPFNAMAQLMINQSYREPLLIQCVQQGIDIGGIFEAGGRINDGGGQSWGITPFAILAGVALDEEAHFDGLINEAPGEFIEFATTFSVTAGQISSGVYNYNIWRLTTSSITGTPTGTITGGTSGATGTYHHTDSNKLVVYNVTGDFEAEEVTFSGGSATVTAVVEVENTFPATVRESYLYVPEWKFGTDAVDGATSPDKWWEVTYRQCCSFAGQYVAGAFLCWVDKETTFDDGEFLDYLDRYEYVERVEQGNAFTYSQEWQYDLYVDNRATLRGAFAVTDVSFNADTQILTITTNRYATSEAGAGLALTGGLTLSNFTPQGATSFTFDVDGDARGETLSYTPQDSPDEFVDAGNNELPEFSEMAVGEESDGGGIGGITSSPAGWLRRRRLKF
jgi:hypothetical protein